MSLSPHLSLLKTPSKKRIRESEDESRLPKRRRASISFGLVLRTELASTVDASENESIQTNSSRDRFLPTRTTTAPFYDLNTTSVQSARMARALGLMQPRLLSFRDDTTTSLLAHQLSDPTLALRTHLSESLTSETTSSASTHSAAKHGKIKPEKVLDSGPMSDFPLHPCAWSREDVIAAVIENRVFIQDMETNKPWSLPVFGRAACVEWTSGTVLVVGCKKGEIALHDAPTGRLFDIFLPRDITMRTFLFSLSESSRDRVNTMSWSEGQRVLAAGRETGEVTYFDPRTHKAIRNDMGPSKGFVTNVEWSPDGLFLASGHRGGNLRCMDWRANKAFELCLPRENKAHRLVVRSLSWAPWNPRLLATGGGAHDHTIKIWSISGSENSSCSGPLHTIPFSSSISSLHFSPHTTELLSTHGEPAISPTSRTTSLRSCRRPNSRFIATPSPKLPVTRNGILVHTYPSFERVHAVQNAHSAPIIDSVLSPDGTRLMTFGEDGSLRQWIVWGSRTPEKAIAMENRLSIR